MRFKHVIGWIIAIAMTIFLVQCLYILSLGIEANRVGSSMTATLERINTVGRVSSEDAEKLKADERRIAEIRASSAVLPDMLHRLIPKMNEPDLGNGAVFFGAAILLLGAGYMTLRQFVDIKSFDRRHHLRRWIAVALFGTSALNVLALRAGWQGVGVGYTVLASMLVMLLLPTTRDRKPPTEA